MGREGEEKERVQGRKMVKREAVGVPASFQVVFLKYTSQCSIVHVIW